MKTETTYPYYTQTGAHAYKVIDKFNCVCVLKNKGSEAISIYHAELANENNSVICTEKEFLAAFRSVSDIIRHKALGTTPEQEKEQKRYEIASHYLIDTDTPFSEQFEMIKAAVELDDCVSLGDIEGVTAWEKVETMYASEFLDIINNY